MDYQPQSTWRLLIHDHLDGATNMAIDEAIADAVRERIAPPTLRFYQWRPAALSLGRMQKIATVDRERCAERGYDLVRRSSGGRAVLHIDELTYSITAAETEPCMMGGIIPSYRRISEGMVRGLAQIDIQADQTEERPDRGAESGPICFDVSSMYELTFGGRKVIGSAQKRSKGVVMQHGAIPLGGDIGRITDILTYTPEEREAERTRIRSLATTIEDVAGQRLPAIYVADAIAAGLSKKLNVGLVSAELTDFERDRYQQLRAEKYANSDWTERL